MLVLRRAVLKTRRVPGLRSLYKGIYAGACSISSRALRALPGMAGVYLHRGLSRDGWEPGVSDIDLILLREGGGQEGEFLERLARRLAALRRLFPMLGDVWLGSPEETRDYLRWGGLRAWEDVPHWRLLRGQGLEFPGLAESSLKRRWLDPWVWLFLSHMEICRRVFGAAQELPETRDAHIRKMYLDARRYCDFILAGDAAGEAPRARAQAQESLGGAARMDPREMWLDSALRLARASRLVLARASSLSASIAFPAPLPGSEVEERMQDLLSCTSAARCVISDQPYHTYVLLSDSARAADYETAAESLLKKPQPGVAVVLEPRTWALALQCSYLGAPLGWLGSGEGQGSAQGRELFLGWGACAVGEPLREVPLLEQQLKWETAAEAASWMLLWWRSLWIAPHCPNRFVVYHLYTRALALRLILEGGVSGPFCDWELLLARLAARFPQERRFLGRVKALLLNETASSLDSRARGALAPEHLGALARLMAGLRQALTRQEHSE